MEKLALFGGERTVKDAPMELFSWPIITEEDEAAALDVIRNNKFSGDDITQKFEEEFAAWQGRKYAVAYCNGTAALTASMFAIGLSMGDEIICTTKTYWASVSQSLTFGATPVFCNIDEHLSMDPDDIETLSDILVAAVNEAIKRVEDTNNNEISKITGQVSMPGIPGLM